MATPADPVVEILGEEWGAIGRLGSELDTADWGTVSECPGWTVHDVLSHVVGTERSLLGDETPPAPSDVPAHVHNPVGALNEAWVVALRSRTGPELLEEFTEVTGRRLEQLRSWPLERFEEVGPSPVGNVAYREFMNVRVMDCWVHEQDIRVATGRPGHRRGPAAELSIARIASAMGFVVGKQAKAPEGASVRFELLGELPRRIDIAVREGRAVPVEDLGGDPTVVLTMDQEAFWRLGCGRLLGDRALSEGLVETSGDVGLGRTVIGSMKFMI